MDKALLNRVMVGSMWVSINRERKVESELLIGQMSKIIGGFINIQVSGKMIKCMELAFILTQEAGRERVSTKMGIDFFGLKMIPQLGDLKL